MAEASERELQQVALFAAACAPSPSAASSSESEASSTKQFLRHLKRVNPHVFAEWYGDDDIQSPFSSPSPASHRRARPSPRRVTFQVPFTAHEDAGPAAAEHQ